MAPGDRPPFTVVIPTYRRPALVGRAIRSVLAQDFEPFEVLVVDDASGDDTRAAVESIADPRLRYVCRERNGGAGATRNTGLSLARGEWVTVLDDDDLLLPGFLRGMWGMLRDAPAEAAVAWCGVRWVDEAGGEARLVREEVWAPSYATRFDAYLGFLAGRRVGTNCGMTFRRAAFAAVGGFDEAFRGGAEDTDLLIRMVRDYDFRVLPDTLVQVNLHEGPRLRRVDTRHVEGYERILAKHADVLAGRPALAAGLLYKTGWLAYHAGDTVRARRFLAAALRKRPWLVRAWGVLALSVVLGGRGPAVHRRLSEIRRGRRSLA